MARIELKSEGKIGLADRGWRMGKDVDSKVAIVKRQIENFFFLFFFLSFLSLIFPGQGRPTYVSRFPLMSARFPVDPSYEKYHSLTISLLQYHFLFAPASEWLSFANAKRHPHHQSRKRSSRLFPQSPNQPTRRARQMRQKCPRSMIF